MKGLEGLIALVVVIAVYQTDPASLFVFVILVSLTLFALGSVAFGIASLFERFMAWIPGECSPSGQHRREWEISIPVPTFSTGKSTSSSRLLPIDPIQDEEETEPAPFPIDINNARIDDLQRIPFVGKARARKIAQSRPYTSIQELKRIEGFGERMIHQISDFIEVGRIRKAARPGE